jgi:hypothetical protein
VTRIPAAKRLAAAFNEASLGDPRSEGKPVTALFG